MKKHLLIFLVVLFVFTPVHAKDEKYIIVGGDINTVGSEICFNTECFYVVSNDGNFVTLFSKYNLLVGNQYNLADDIVTPLVNPTGIQDATAKGYFRGNSATNPLIGTIPFSNSVYWSGDNYPNYIYNSSSNIYDYVNAYGNYLNGLGVRIHNSRLITYEELVSLGCVLTKNMCSGAPSWVYSTTYWTGSAGSNDKVWNVISNSYAYADLYNCNRRGVRPIIEIPNGWFLSSDNTYIGNVYNPESTDETITYVDNAIEIKYEKLDKEKTYNATIYNDKDYPVIVSLLNINSTLDSILECRLDEESTYLKIEPYSSANVTFYVKPKVIIDSNNSIDEPLKITFAISEAVDNPDTFYSLSSIIILILVFSFCFISMNYMQKQKR